MENRESGLWIPASQHQGEYEEEDDEEEEPSDVAANGEARGREEEREQTARGIEIGMWRCRYTLALMW